MNKYQETAKELNARLKLSFNKKIELSMETIKIAIDQSKKPVIASSFGKDSMALIDLIYSYKKNIPLVFTNTGVCFKETIEFKKQIVKDWNLKLFEIHPDMTFWEIVKIHGYPKKSRSSKTGDKREPACCKILKFKPMEKFVREYKPDMVFVGLTGDEGRQRRWAYICHDSAVYEHVALGVKKCIPLIWWKQKDVWHDIEVNNIPITCAYKKYCISRTGCIPCTGHIGWESQLARTFPKLYERIQRDLGQTLIDSNFWNKEFDSIGVIN